MVLLYSEASHGFWEGFSFFGEKNSKHLSIYLYQNNEKRKKDELALKL